jgi:hypothetical protein
MKQIKKTVLVLLTAALFAGCNDWFDVKPKTEIRAEDLFKTERGFWNALTGVYLNMANREAYGGNLSWEGIEFMAWQHKNNTTLGAYYDLQRGNYTATSSVNFINKTWLRLYNIIAEANYLLFALDEYGSYLSPAVYDHIKGQCLGIRAYCHFDLMRLFAQGNLAADPSSLTKPCIPYVTAYSKEITPQQSYSWTLNRALQDVMEARDLLDAGEYPKEQRVSTEKNTLLNVPGAMDLLAARIELWRGNTEAALPHITDHVDSLLKNTTVGITNDESIFKISVYNLFTWTEKRWEVTNNNRLISVTPNSVEANLFMILPYQANYGVDKTDLRYLNWYDPYEEGDPEKWGDRSIKVEYFTNSDENYITLMRLSEMLLIAAECQLAKGTSEGKAKAIELVNYLRHRRGNPSGYDVADDVADTDLLEIIRLEQLREVSQEGQAFFLYKRINQERPINSENPMTAAEYVLPYPQGEQQVGHQQ